MGNGFGVRLLGIILLSKHLQEDKAKFESNIQLWHVGFWHAEQMGPEQLFRAIWTMPVFSSLCEDAALLTISFGKKPGRFQVFFKLYLFKNKKIVLSVCWTVV